MKRLPPSRLLVLTPLLTASLFVIAFRFSKSGPSTANQPLGRPNVILWAWERPEDLRFIDKHKVAVAFLARTIFLRGSQVISKPRLQPLTLADDTIIIPVARIEVDKQEHADLSDQQAKDAAIEISELASTKNVATVQIDFDATSSQRQFYRTLLIALRERLPATTKLSITALGSWCEGDVWLEDLPVDEVVPMLFRMGIDRNGILSQLATKGFNSSRCQTTAGISTDEAIENLPTVTRLYVFNPNGWDRDSVNKVMENFNR